MNLLVLLVVALSVFLSFASVEAGLLEDELNSMRAYSICAPDGIEETAIGSIKTNDRTFQPIILSRSMALYDNVLYERAEVWYSDIVDKVVPVTVPMNGDVYYTLVPVGAGTVERLLLPRGARRDRRIGNLPMHQEANRTDIPLFGFTLCSNLHPGKYSLSKEGTDIVGVPHQKGAPQIRVITRDRKLALLVLQVAGDKWYLSFDKYQVDPEGYARPYEITVTGPYGQTVLTVLAWVSVPITSQPEQFPSLDKSFGIPESQFGKLPKNQQLALLK